MFLMILTVLRRTGQAFFRVSLCCDLSDSVVSKRLYLFIFREEGREKERERNINEWLPLMCSTLETWLTTQARALDWESKCQLFGIQAGTQPTEPHKPELIFF